MAASNLLYSCPVFRVNRVFLTFLAAKSLYLYYQLKKKLLADQDMWCREENFIVFMYVLRSIVTPWSGLRNSRDQNHVHIYFVIFPWLALYVALVYLIHRWTMLEKMRKTLSEAILVAIKVLMENVCACEKRDLVKPRFWKRAWILLRREVNYFKNKSGDPTIFF